MRQLLFSALARDDLLQIARFIARLFEKNSIDH